MSTLYVLPAHLNRVQGHIYVNNIWKDALRFMFDLLLQMHPFFPN